jgi:hypothetical protein
VLNTARHLERMGISDRHLMELVRYLEADATVPRSA